MRRTLLTVRGVAIPSYPAMLYLGAVLGIVAQNAAANAAGLPPARVCTWRRWCYSPSH